MSKIRIYELAKELGVDNKVVLSKAQELGFRGKSSHSHSLDADEADAVRRAIIRQAMGAPKEINSEVMTTRVDKVTGATEAVVEKRSGNVIRRRRSNDGPEVTPAPASTVQAQPVASTGEDYAASVAMTPSPSVSADGGAAREMVAAAAPELVEETEEARPLESAQEETVDTAGSVDAAPSKVEAPPTVVAEPEVTETRPGIGPRILGRIELPAARKPVVKPTPEARRTAPGAAKEAPREIFDSEEESGKKKGAAKKGRKREISSVDLLD